MGVGVLEAVGLLVAEHGESLAGAGGPVGEDSGVLAGEDGADERLDGLLVDLFRGLAAVDAVEGVALLLGAVVDLQHLAVLLLELPLHRVQDDLPRATPTIRFSWMRITSQFPALTSLWFRGRTRIATRMFDSPSPYLSMFKFHALLASDPPPSKGSQWRRQVYPELILSSWRW